MRRMRIAAALLAMMLGPLPALAHQITVFATVANGMVDITASFADGTPVMAGTLRILDAQDKVVFAAPLDGATVAPFPVGPHTDGMTIEVDAGGGHANYWVLTPRDLAN